LCDKKDAGHYAVSKFGDKYQIKSRIGSDIAFNITFDGIRFVFINEKSWMIYSIYRVSSMVVKEFASTISLENLNGEGELDHLAY
jgi:hypothetical protein